MSQISSPWDIAVIMLARTLHEAKKTTDRILEKHKDKTQEYLFVPYVELKHFPKTYLAKISVKVMADINRMPTPETIAEMLLILLIME